MLESDRKISVIVACSSLVIGAGILFLCWKVSVFPFMKTKGDSSGMAQSGQITQSNANVNAPVTGKDAVNQFFNSGKNSEFSQGNIRWANFNKNPGNAGVTIDSMLPKTQTGSLMKDNFLRLVDQQNFDIFQCKEGGMLNQGIYFTLNGQYSGGSGGGPEQALDSWGPYILSDMATILFPGKLLSAMEQQQADMVSGTKERKQLFLMRSTRYTSA